MTRSTPAIFAAASTASFRFSVGGVTITSYDKNWGGSPVELSYNDAIVQGKGVYIEELEKAIQARGLEVPPFYGLALDDESVDLPKIISDFRDFIQSVCQ